MPFQGGSDKVCSDDDLSYLYWDRLHPSTRIHCGLAGSILNQLNGTWLSLDKFEVSDSFAACKQISGQFE